MEGFKAFLKRKNIEISAKRYGIDALGAMAKGIRDRHALLPKCHRMPFPQN